MVGIPRGSVQLIDDPDPPEVCLARLRTLWQDIERDRGDAPRAGLAINWQGLLLMLPALLMMLLPGGDNSKWRDFLQTLVDMLRGVFNPPATWKVEPVPPVADGPHLGPGAVPYVAPTETE